MIVAVLIWAVLFVIIMAAIAKDIRRIIDEDKE